MHDNIRSIEKMGKEAIIAVIERRGEIIYYKVNLKKFDKNIKLVEKIGENQLQLPYFSRYTYLSIALNSKSIK